MCGNKATENEYEWQRDASNGMGDVESEKRKCRIEKASRGKKWNSKPWFLFPFSSYVYFSIRTAEFSELAYLCFTIARFIFIIGKVCMVFPCSAPPLTLSLCVSVSQTNSKHQKTLPLSLSDTRIYIVTIPPKCLFAHVLLCCFPVVLNVWMMCVWFFSSASIPTYCLYVRVCFYFCRHLRRRHTRCRLMLLFTKWW